MILLSVTALRKHYGPEPVLNGVEFDVHPGQKIGLVGPNGTGKSTLMKILAGKEEPDAGTCLFHPHIRVGYLEQQPEPSMRTLWEEAHLALADLVTLQQEALNVAEALGQETDPEELHRLGIRYDHIQHELMRQDAYNLEYKIERVLHGLGFTDSQWNTPVSALSGGEQNRLMLAKLLLAEPDLMLLDEPSNHLDLGATEWLESFLMESDAAVIVVSHDRYFLDRVTNRTLELFHGTTDSYSGNFSAYMLQKEERLLVQQRTYEKQREEIAKAEDFIRRNHYGMKAAQAEDRRKKLERIERVTPPRHISAPCMGFPPAERSGDIVLRVENLAMSYERPLFSDVTFTIQRGERWGLLGPNGCGKTTLLKCLLGLEKPDAGKFSLGNAVYLGYFDQQLGSVAADKMVVDAIRPTRTDMDEPARRNLLARFGLTGDQAFQMAESLSGGERCRAALAKLAADNPNFLILDEPTNHLDLWARKALELSIHHFEGTLLFVSHDRYFINQVATHLLILENGCARVIQGNYNEYLRLKRLNDSGKGETAQANSFTRKDDLWKQSALQKKKNPTPKQDAAREKKRTVKDEYRKPDAVSSSENSDESHAEISVSDFSHDFKKEKPKRVRKFPFRKVTDLEDEIFVRETQVQSLQNDLMNPNILRDGNKVRQIQAEIQAEQELLKTLYEHWEEATELNW